MRQCFLTICIGIISLAASIQTVNARTLDTDAVNTDLQQAMAVDIAVNNTENQRWSIIRDFVKDLKNLNDLELGSPELLAASNDSVNDDEQESKIKLFAEHMKEIFLNYQTSVKPILLNNVKLKRRDDFAKQNKGELSGLFSKVINNHRTGRPVTGILNYKVDVSDSFFSEEIVDAGLLINFPELEHEIWVSDALRMEDELLVLYRMHRTYLDGIKYEKANQSEVISKAISSKKIGSYALLKGEDLESLAATEKALHVIPISKSKAATPQTRVDSIHTFVRSLKKVNVGQDIRLLKEDLVSIVSMYHEQVKPILMDNVKLNRDDDAAKQNSGELLSLFFPHSRNHHTGKPISGMLRYQQDVSSFFSEEKLEEAGVLTEHPELEKEKFIQDALTMESELIVLAEQHRKYLNQGTSIF
ncbi:MAG: hypothetical protein R8M46_04260 [Ghiorsea sp.]